MAFITASDERAGRYPLSSPVPEYQHCYQNQVLVITAMKRPGHGLQVLCKINSGRKASPSAFIPHVR